MIILWMLIMNWAVINKLDKIQYLWYTIKEKGGNIEKNYDDINVLLTYAYSLNGVNYKVVPFTKIQTELNDYKIYYEKYNNIITTLSDAYNTSFDDVYDKIRNGIDTLYFKYDASMKEYDTRIDSSFRTILQYINTSVAILRN